MFSISPMMKLGSWVLSYQLVKVVSGRRAHGTSSIFASPQLLVLEWFYCFAMFCGNAPGTSLIFVLLISSTYIWYSPKGAFAACLLLAARCVMVKQMKQTVPWWFLFPDVTFHYLMWQLSVSPCHGDDVTFPAWCNLSTVFVWFILFELTAFYQLV